MTSFFLIVSFHLDKSNFQVFVLNSSSQFHGIKEKELTLFNIHFKKSLGRKLSILQYKWTSWLPPSVNFSYVSSLFVIDLHLLKFITFGRKGNISGRKWNQLKNCRTK